MNDDAREIYLGQGKWAVVDAASYPSLLKYAWRVEKKKRSWYAYTVIKGHKRTFKLYMHRLVASTPANMITHHKNRISLDNRRRNLQNMLRSDHKIEHLDNPIKVRTQGTFTGPAEL